MLMVDFSENAAEGMLVLIASHRKQVSSSAVVRMACASLVFLSDKHARAELYRDCTLGCVINGM